MAIIESVKENDWSTNTRGGPNVETLVPQKPRKCFGFPLRSITIVIVNDAAQHVAAAHRATGSATWFGGGNLLIDALMRARGVEERHVVTHDPTQIHLVDDQQLVQALVAPGANQPHGVGICIRCTIGGKVTPFGLTVSLPALPAAVSRPATSAATTLADVRKSPVAAAAANRRFALPSLHGFTEFFWGTHVSE